MKQGTQTKEDPVSREADAFFFSRGEQSGISKPQRITYHVDAFAIGGIETHTMDLACQVAQRGFEVHVILPVDPTLDPMVDVLEASGIPVLRMNLLGNQPPLRLLANLVRLRRWLREQRIDVLHIQRSLPHRSKWAILTARVADVPVIVATDHGIPDPHLGRVQRWQTRLADRLVAAVAVVSDYGRRLRLERTDICADKLHVLYNGIDTEHFTPGAPEGATALGLPSDAPVIGTLGRLEPQKGITYLLEATAMLAGRWPVLTVLIAGQGSLREELKAKAKALGVVNHVRFLGFIPVREAVDFLRLLDVFVLPSRWETFGLAAAEAMAVGVPAVVANVGGLPEVVADGETGLVVPPHNPEALAAAIERLIQNDQLRQCMARAGRQRVEALFSVEAMADKTITLYGALWKGHRNHA